MYEVFHFNYARDSLRYLIRLYDIKELFIPYYLCDVIRHSVISENCKPLFYHIDDSFMPAQDFPKDFYILYPNYFGICDDNVDKLVKIYPKLIVDNAHSYFSPPQCFACFNSERKFLPVEKGSDLWIKNEFKGTKINKPQTPTERINKFKELHKKYRSVNCLKLQLSKIRSPFCYPCLTKTDEEADILAYKLKKERKTIYRYWNSLPKNYNEYKFYRRLVPIPLD